MLELVHIMHFSDDLKKQKILNSYIKDKKYPELVEKCQEFLNQGYIHQFMEEKEIIPNILNADVTKSQEKLIPVKNFIDEEVQEKEN
jgi:hypothetical protein